LPTSFNAGSSSLKFSLFVVRGDDLTLDARGQIEGLPADGQGRRALTSEAQATG